MIARKETRFISTSVKVFLKPPFVTSEFAKTYGGGVENAIKFYSLKNEALAPLQSLLNLISADGGERALTCVANLPM